MNCLKCGTEVANRRSDAKYCSRKCSNAVRQAAYAARQPAETRATWRKYFYTEKGTITSLLGGAMDRSKRDGLPYHLDRKWLEKKLKPMLCEMTGLPLERGPRGKFRTNPFAPSLDRIDPRLGYVKSNVRVIAFIVNRSRSDFGDEILMKMARALVHKELTS